MDGVTLDAIAEAFDEVVDLAGVTLREDTVLGEDLPVDSREMLRVLSRLEGRYRIRFTPADVLGMRTLGDVLRAVERRAVAR